MVMRLGDFHRFSTAKRTDELIDKIRTIAAFGIFFMTFCLVGNIFAFQSHIPLSLDGM